MLSLYNIQMAVNSIRISDTMHTSEQLRVRLQEYYEEIVAVLEEFDLFSREVGRLLKKYRECEPVQFVHFLRELVEKCKHCRSQVQKLIKSHVSVQQLFDRIAASLRNGQSAQGRKKGGGRTRPSEEAIIIFSSSCEALQREVESITPFLDGEVNTCEEYLKAAEGRSRKESIDRALEFANKWCKYQSVLKRTVFDIQKNSDALVPPPKDDLPKKSRCMIV